MSFSIGTTSVGHGPGGILRGFADEDERGRVWDAHVVSRMLAYLKPHWASMSVAFVLTLISAGLGLAVPYLIKIAIDQHIVNRDLAGLDRIALLTMGAFIGLYLSSAVQQYLLSLTGQEVLGEMRGQLVRHLQDLHLGYHDTHIIGVTISRVFSDVGVINDLLSQGLITLASDVLTLVGIIVVMVLMSPRLALLSFSVVPLMVVATMIFARHAKVAFRET
ncbi:MAG: ABC transporter ATP-binding protein, partial [Anaerolineae bacterium]|nr:ABC transporter ATP-binding protein [Anaerolineae bacterium]